ncbi:MAG: TolC family protein [Dehalococcoidia bacterium]
MLFVAAPLSCDTTLPSERLESEVRLPVPNSFGEIPGPERLLHEDRGEAFELSPLSLIHIAFARQPDVKSSYQRFKSEEARYDFFVVSRDSLTPRLRTSNTARESRVDETVVRHRDHLVELSIEKQFFDTTEMDIAVGLQTDADNEAIGYRPVFSASLRYPLWVSRQKLERTSEEIFRRNEMNDAQLGYIQLVRRRLRNSLFRFYEVLDLQRQVENLTAWFAELERIAERIDELAGRNRSTDRSRVEAELTRVSARRREVQGRFEIQRERLKEACGLPFHARLTFLDEPFNPFEGIPQAKLLHLAIETDPEIATLRNEQRNAQVQLDLARRGQWDVTLLLDGRSNLEGGGENEGVSDWSATFGIDVSAVDPRVTLSLTNQAQARIERFRQAIVARENTIFVEIYEPVIRIDTLQESKAELIANLPRFEEDYRKGLAAFATDALNIDDLLKRRENLYDQQQQISRLTFLVGANVAELCSATGKFFELLQDKAGPGIDGTPPDDRNPTEGDVGD